MVGDFLMLGNTNSSSREVRWSADQRSNNLDAVSEGCRLAEPSRTAATRMGLSGFERGASIFQTETVRQMTVRQERRDHGIPPLEASQERLRHSRSSIAKVRVILLRDERLPAHQF